MEKQPFVPDPDDTLRERASLIPFCVCYCTLADLLHRPKPWQLGSHLSTNRIFLLLLVFAMENTVKVFEEVKCFRIVIVSKWCTVFFVRSLGVLFAALGLRDSDPSPATSLLCISWLRMLSPVGLSLTVRATSARTRICFARCFQVVACFPDPPPPRPSPLLSTLFRELLTRLRWWCRPRCGTTR